MVIKRAEVLQPTWKEFKIFPKYIDMLIAAGEPKNGITVVSSHFFLLLRHRIFYRHVTSPPTLPVEIFYADLSV